MVFNLDPYLGARAFTWSNIAKQRQRERERETKNIDR